MPVLPDVGSTRTVFSGLILPLFSSDSIMLTPIRSLTLAMGLKNSSLARRTPLTPFSRASLSSRTIGVSPMVWVIELYIRPRPGLAGAEKDVSVVMIPSLLAFSFIARVSLRRQPSSSRGPGAGNDPERAQPDGCRLRCPEWIRSAKTPAIASRRRPSSNGRSRRQK